MPAPICIPTNIAQRFVDKGTQTKWEKTYGNWDHRGVPSNEKLNHGGDPDIVLGALRAESQGKKYFGFSHLPIFNFTAVFPHV